ncbi:MAG TPA: hypothetical protein VGL66_15980 [Caulobacteraceae bacterium]|jgi:hypothetical protein
MTLDLGTLDLGTLLLITAIVCISLGGGWLLALIRRRSRPQSF